MMQSYLCFIYISLNDAIHLFKTVLSLLSQNISYYCFTLKAIKRLLLLWSSDRKCSVFVTDVTADIVVRHL